MGQIKNVILDTLFPRHCLGCQIDLIGHDGSYICSDCLINIKIRQGFNCAFCGAPTTDGKICPFCKSAHSLDGLLVACSYEETSVKQLLKYFKYDFIESLATNISDLMTKFIRPRISKLGFDNHSLLVTAVPLHWYRLNWRGFNQSELMARNISECFDWQSDFRLLKRLAARTPQADIKDRLQRIKNVENIFSCFDKSEIIGKRILLIDDVSTTGSTLDACAKALRLAGAVEVTGFVFARN